MKAEKLQICRPQQEHLPAFALPALFEDLSDGVILAGPDRRIRWVNPALTRIFGYTPQDLLGKETRMLYADEAAFLEQRKIRFNPESSTTSHRYEVSYRRKNGRVFASQTTASPVRNAEGGVDGYLAIIKDMSEQHAYEALLRQLYAISSCSEMSGSGKIRAILRLGLERFGTSTAIVSWIQGSTYTVLLSESDVHEVPPGTAFDLGDTYCVHTLQAEGPLAFHQVGSSRISGHPCYAMFRLETYIGVPLIVGGKRFGTLNFTCLEDRDPFPEADLELIRFFAAWVALELNVQNTINRLTEDARTDPLTGCLTRRAWFEAAKEAAADDGPHALVLLDLDDFKAVNDTLGHPAGDDVLRQCGRLFQAHCRRGDAAGRVGGEEFALLLRGTSLQDGVAAAERLRAEIAGTRFEAGVQTTDMAASFGVARLMPGECVDKAYRNADEALYAAKRNGRNQVSSSVDTSDQGEGGGSGPG